MKNIVYFLGAGASKAFGNPLTNEIMPLILQKLKTNTLFCLDEEQTDEERAYEEMLSWMLDAVYPGLKKLNSLTKSHQKLMPSITEVLSLIDHFCFYNLPPHPEIADAKLQQFKYLLERAVGEVIWEQDEEGYTTPQKNLLEKFIKPIRNAKVNGRCTIITTNYDLIIDQEFNKQMLKHQVDYGIPYRTIEDKHIRQRNPSPVLHYYKLHGSLNWLRCDLCGYYYINPEGHIIHQAFKDEVEPNNTCLCSDKLKLKSVIVSPSYIRDIRDANLLQIWKAALESIRTADEIYFFGYSLPAEDFGIKSILIRALNGRKKSPKVTVVVNDNNSKQSFLNIFGGGIDYHAKGLQTYLSRR